MLSPCECTVSSNLYHSTIVAGDIEERHYNLQVQVENLPETCTDQQLVVVGWLVEDVVQDMEEKMPEYQGEDWITSLCPLPEKSVDAVRSRILSAKTSLRRALGKRRSSTYTYDGSGRCRRCSDPEDRRRHRDLGSFGVDAKINVESTVTEAESSSPQQPASTTQETAKTDHSFGVTEAASSSLHRSTLLALSTDLTSSISAQDSKLVENSSVYGRRGGFFIQLVENYLSQSSTECEFVEAATNDKAVAETSSVIAEETLDMVLDMASNYQGNQDITTIVDAARDAHEEVMLASESAAGAATTTESSCSDAQRVRDDSWKQKLLGRAQDSADEAAQHAAAARDGLFRLREAENDMKVLTAVLEYDIGSGEMEKELMEEGQSLVEKIDEVVDEIKQVDSNISQATDESLLQSLGMSRDTLVEEGEQLEKLLQTNQDILTVQTDLKKEIFEEEVRPDFNLEDPLHFMLVSFGEEKKSHASWDIASETTSSNEEWFRKFGNLVVDVIPRTLMLVFNTTSGGCITEDTVLQVTINLTEVPIWETNNPATCFMNALVPP